MSGLILPEKNIIYTMQNDVQEIFNQVFKPLSLSYFHYTRLYLDGTFFTLGTIPIWQQCFFKELFSAKDYQYSSSCFIDNVYLPARFPHIAQRAADFNIKNMFSIVIKTLDYYDIFGFASQLPDSLALDFYFNNLEGLRNATVHFKERSSKIIRACQNQKLTWEIEKPAPSLGIANQNSSGERKNNFIYEKNSLTQREIECLTYLSQGMTAKEIGKIMKISHRTVEVYISHIKEKTNIRRKSGLIYSFNNFLL